MQQHKSHYKIIVFLSLILSFIVICTVLGFWQLHRAAYKQDLLNKFHKNAKISIDEKTLKAQGVPLAFQKVKLQGRFDNQHIILIDNKMNKGIPGYHVVIPFHSKNNHNYLVNVGWYEAGFNRQQLPIIPAISGTHTIEGYIILPEKPLVLKNIPPAKSWPLLLQWPNITLIKQYTQINFPNYIIWLPTNQQVGFVKDWSIKVFKPQLHTAYAFQWFTMAAILLICGIIIVIKTFVKRD